MKIISKMMAAAALMLTAMTAEAQICLMENNDGLTYQTVITNEGNVVNGDIQLVFEFYGGTGFASTGFASGNLIWKEVHEMAIENGYVTAAVGAINAKNEKYKYNNNDVLASIDKKGNADFITMLAKACGIKIQYTLDGSKYTTLGEVPVLRVPAAFFATKASYAETANTAKSADVAQSAQAIEGLEYATVNVTFKNTTSVSHKGYFYGQSVTVPANGSKTITVNNYIPGCSQNIYVEASDNDTKTDNVSSLVAGSKTKDQTVSGVAPAETKNITVNIIKAKIN
ncbi:MAG: hypothetical protein MJZ01_04940 [Bacteroidales bacterium]|nr:hypothetical protein [Bacteroidales bacterium]